MGKLKYKTRGMSSPQGKPKAYFCCHPDDVCLFDEISDDILKFQNCSVWYYDKNTKINDSEHYTDLAEMNLFVMPVTTRLLCTENRALLFDLPYALERNIPVLPLMQEEGLVDIFNEKVGSMQFLDKNSKDDTAISFEDKLQKYLSSVLIGDELAEKIRQAFDAYVFLSYRKKDRKYAKDLMRLIHKNDFCRDIAIWYDEFLNPGENFNDSIRAALEKSKLFVLAVTPNLVNEENYIMTTEYPMAKDAGKEIFPAELVETDRKALREKYEAIPECTNAYDDAAMTEALLKAVDKMAISRGASSPEHDFFIGLAYLDGIDVEVDHIKALAIIESAAEAGVPEACEQLVQMYTNGKGVKRDYLKAAEWKSKKAELYRKRYWEEATLENGHSYLWELIYLGDCYRDMEMEEDALKTFHKAYGFAENCNNKFELPVCESDLSACASRLGRLYRSMGDMECAKEFIEIDLRISQKNAEIYGDPRLKYLVGVSYSDLASVCLATQNLDEAVEYGRKTLDIYESLQMMSGDADDKQEFAIALSRYADICVAIGNYSDAYKYQIKALRIYEDISGEDDSVYCRGNIAGVCEDLSDICVSEGDLSGARKYLDRSFAIVSELYEQFGTLQLKMHMALNHAKQGRLSVSEGDLGEARAYFEKSFEIYEKLADETGSKYLLKELATTSEDICQVYIDESIMSEARRYCQKSRDIREYLLNYANNAYNRHGLFVSLGKLGDIEYYEENYDEARRCYRKAVDCITGFDREAENTLEFRAGLATAIMRIGDVYFEERDFEEAKKYYIDGVRIREECAEKTKTLTDEKSVAISYIKLGMIYHRLDDEKNSASLYQKAIDILEKMVGHTDNVDVYIRLSNAYERMGNIYIGRRDAEGAEPYILKCYDIRRKLIGIYRSAERIQDLAYSCDKLGLIYRALGDTKKSKGYYLECKELREEYLERVDSLEVKDDLSGVYHWIGVTYMEEGDVRTAREYCEKEVALCEEILQRTGTYQSLDSLADTYYEAAYFYDDERRLTYLKKAKDAFERLYRDCPEVERYPECVRIVRESVEKTEKALRPKGIFGRLFGK